MCRVAGDMAQEERHGGTLANRAVCRQPETGEHLFELGELLRVRRTLHPFGDGRLGLLALLGSEVFTRLAPCPGALNPQVIRQTEAEAVAGPAPRQAIPRIQGLSTAIWRAVEIGFIVSGRHGR